VQFVDEYDGDEAEDEVSGDVYGAVGYDVDVDDGAWDALYEVGDAWVPVDAEGSALQELEEGLGDEGEE
jgi:hypothetical protein